MYHVGLNFKTFPDFLMIYGFLLEELSSGSSCCKSLPRMSDDFYTCEIFDTAQHSQIVHMGRVVLGRHRVHVTSLPCHNFSSEPSE